MKNNIENWWAIKFYPEDKFNHPNEHYQHVYIQGYDAILVNEHLVDIDNNLLYYPYKIESVTKAKYFDKLFEAILNTYCKNEYSYYGTWNKLERFFTGIICDKVLTQDMIEKNSIRFSYNRIIYEYSFNTGKIKVI